MVSTECVLAITPQQGVIAQLSLAFGEASAEQGFTPTGLQKMTDFIEACASQLKSKNLEIHFLLQASFARYLMVTPFANTSTLADAESSAAYRFKELYGQHAGNDWLIRGNWSSQRPFLANAIAKALLNQLNALSQLAAVRRHAVYPLTTYVLGALHLPSVSLLWMIVNEPQCDMICVIDHGHMISLRALPINRDHTDAEHQAILHAAILREATVLNQAMPEQVFALGYSEDFKLSHIPIRHLKLPAKLRWLEKMLSTPCDAVEVRS